jgi:hypothetical protein
VSAENEVERLNNAIRSHPEYLKEREEMQRKWEEEQMEPVKDALHQMRKFIPHNLSNVSVQNMVDGGLPRECAVRLQSKKHSLRLIVTHIDTVKTMHSAMLSLCANQGLDIVEMRAIYACLPQKFDFDGDGKKAEWRANFEQKLKELVKKGTNGNLRPDEERHHAYKEAEFELIRREEEKSEKKPYYYDPMLPLIPPLPVAKSTAFQPTKPDFLPNKGQGRKVPVTKENGATARLTKPPNQMRGMLNELKTHKKSSGKIDIK